MSADPEGVVDAAVGSGSGVDAFVDGAAAVEAFEVAASVGALLAVLGTAVDAEVAVVSGAVVVVAFCVVAKATKHATRRRAIDNLVSMVTVSV